MCSSYPSFCSPFYREVAGAFRLEGSRSPRGGLQLVLIVEYRKTGNALRAEVWSCLTLMGMLFEGTAERSEGARAQFARVNSEQRGVTGAVRPRVPQAH